MSNLTLSIDAHLLHRARIRAAQQGTSVNAVVRDLLTAWAIGERVVSARRRLVAESIASASGSRGELRLNDFT